MVFHLVNKMLLPYVRSLLQFGETYVCIFYCIKDDCAN